MRPRTFLPSFGLAAIAISPGQPVRANGDGVGRLAALRQGESSAATSAVKVLEQPSRMDAECTRDAEEIEQPQVPLAAFNAAEVGPMQPGAGRQFFLGSTDAFALYTNTGAEPLEIFGAHVRMLAVRCLWVYSL